MPFDTTLDLRAIPGGEWMVLHDFRYTFKGGAITVPRGFKTDLASIPRTMRWLVTGMRASRMPAVIHDYLYREGLGSRKGADLVFLQCLKECGMGWLRRHMMYRAVRVFGGSSFKGEK